MALILRSHEICYVRSKNQKIHQNNEKGTSETIKFNLLTNHYPEGLLNSIVKKIMLQYEQESAKSNLEDIFTVPKKDIILS